MRTKAIKTLAEKTGDAETAGAIWDMFVSKTFAGREPSEAMFKMLPKEKALDAMPVGFHGPLAALWPETPEAPKGRKFKAGRSYTAAEYAGFYEHFPENVSLCEDIGRATDGKPWVVFTTKFHVAQSAKFIGWHMAEDIAPATIDVDGVPVAPVLPGEERRKEAKEYPVDPHTPGGFLNVENKSPRTHADFTGYSEEEIQATIMAYPKLAGMDDLSLQNLTLANKGKGAAAILKPFPEIAAAWAAMKPKDRPCTKAPKRPFVEPPAPAAPRGRVDTSHRAPRVVVLGAQAAPEEWSALWKHLVVIHRAGKVVFTADSDAPLSSRSVRSFIDEQIAQADFLMCLLTPTTMGTDLSKRAAQFNGRVIPVLLGYATLDYTWFEGKVCLPQDGRPAHDEARRSAVAKNIAEIATAPRPKATYGQ